MAVPLAFLMSTSNGSDLVVGSYEGNIKLSYKYPIYKYIQQINPLLRNKFPTNKHLEWKQNAALIL